MQPIGVNFFKGILGWFIFSRIKKGEGQGKEKCHAKSMMSKEANERLKILPAFFFFVSLRTRESTLRLL